jgi:hypothetical protein
MKFNIYYISSTYFDFNNSIYIYWDDFDIILLFEF